MRIGIISDIHANFEALKESFNTLKKTGFDKIVCLGDIVGYGAEPRECIDFLIEHNIASIRGNHDHYVIQNKESWDIQPYAEKAISWTKKNLGKDYIDYLSNLPFVMQEANCLFIHASLDAIDGEYWPYILDPKSALFHFFLQDTPFAFFGHTHIPLLFSYDNEHKISIEMLNSKKLPEKENCKYLINPGSVGQPRDFDSRSSLIIFDTESFKIDLIRVHYNVKATQEKILSAGLPEILAERLFRGN